MDRKEFEKIVEKHHYFVIKKNLKAKQVSNILKYIAPDINENDIIGFYDGGVMKNGKSGVLIARQGIYSDFRKTKIPFDGIKKFTYTKKGSVNIDATFTYKDGHSESHTLITTCLDELIEIIQEIIIRYNSDTDSSIESKSDTPTVSPDELTRIGEEYYDAKDYEKAYLYLTKAVAFGHPRGMNILGLMYKHGYYVEKNMDTAVSWFKKAADQNYPGALYNLGMYFQNDKKDDKKSFQYFEKAAKIGHAASQNKLGICFEDIIGTRKDVKKAFSWYLKSAEQGYSYGLYNAGRCYHKGIGTKTDREKAIEYYTKAAELGNQAAKEQLYILKPSTPKTKPSTEETTKGKEYYQLAQNGDIEACLLAGEAYMQKGEYEKGGKLLLKADEAGSKKAGKLLIQYIIDGKLAIADSSIPSMTDRAENNVSEEEYDSWIYNTRMNQSDYHLQILATKYEKKYLDHKVDELYSILANRYPHVMKNFSYNDKSKKCYQLKNYIDQNLTAKIIKDLYSFANSAMSQKRYDLAYVYFYRVYEHTNFYFQANYYYFDSEKPVEMVNLQKDAAKNAAHLYLEHIVKDESYLSSSQFYCKDGKWICQQIGRHDSDIAYLLAKHYQKKAKEGDSLTDYKGLYEDWIQKAAELGHRDAKIEFNTLKKQRNKKQETYDKPKVVIDDSCNLCGICVAVCECLAIDMDPSHSSKPVINPYRCIKCYNCIDNCPEDAISYL